MSVDMYKVELPELKQKQHRVDLDIVKAISIIAVVFYHIGWLDTGYLGVDVFFAVNGFLVIPSLLKQISEGIFKYTTFLLKRIMRLWPLILLASAVCLLMGYFVGMLPDDYENLAQSVIASDLMSQNILSAITTKDYWATANEYKPLMHFWYVGILVSFYVVFPLVILLLKWVAKRLKITFLNLAFVALLVIAVASLLLSLSPYVSDSAKFYHLPFRCWEIIAGGIIALISNREESSKHNVWGYISLVGIILILCSSLFLPYEEGGINPVSAQIPIRMLVPQNILLILSVLLTCVVLKNPVKIPQTKFGDMLAFVGRMSFSIYVWHQILLAFYRYFYGNDMSLLFVIGLWTVTLVLSIATYYMIEQRLKATWTNFAASCVCFVAICLSAGLVYLNAGTVRDVPELDVFVGKTHRGQFAEYCDRVYAYNVDFPENEKVNVLVAGVSFGRDFANILLESDMCDKINLSYIFQHDEKYANRYAKCDYFFTFSNKTELPRYVLDNLNPEAYAYGLGTKNYGESSGPIYKRRNDPDYFDSTVKIDPNFYVVNEEWKRSWGAENYVDFLQISSMANGEIRVFTDDNYFISQDCRHLTKNGAVWYAKIIDWNKFFNK